MYFGANIQYITILLNMSKQWWHSICPQNNKELSEIYEKTVCSVSGLKNIYLYQNYFVHLTIF